MPHGVGHRQVQHVAGQAVVEGVSRDARLPAPASAESVNAAASQVRGPGSSRCWISADRLKVGCAGPTRTGRCGAGWRSPRTRAGAPACAISASVSGAGSSGGTARAGRWTSPRSVTGASTVHRPRAPSPPALAGSAPPGRSGCAPPAPPAHRRTAARSRTPRRLAARRAQPRAARRRRRRTSGTCARRTRARPDRSAMRNDTSVAPSATPSSRVTASTASTGEAASAASRTRANLRVDSAGVICGA